MMNRIAVDWLVAAALSAALMVLSPIGVRAKANDKNKPGPAGSSLENYLQRAHAANLEQPATLGSLWISSGSLANAASDYKARTAGDLISVRLLDSFSANTSGENKTGRQFDTKAAVTGLLGQLAATNSLQNLFNATSSNSLDGKGQSTLSSTLQLRLAGRVVDVMPNGVMVIEATRDFTVGNDRQTVVLRGLVRPGDVAIDNSILSTAITSLELEIKGKGAVADATRRPLLPLRLLLKLLSF
jgi:flagellar L-ring protein precursor FlgH